MPQPVRDRSSMQVPSILRQFIPALALLGVAAVGLLLDAANSEPEREMAATGPAPTRPDAHPEARPPATLPEAAVWTTTVSLDRGTIAPVTAAVARKR